MNRRRKKITLFILTFVAMIVAKVLVLLLPSKYFYDNNRIVSMVNHDGLIPSWEGSYQTAADVFSFLNVLKFNTMLEWSFTLGLLFTLLVSTFIFINCELDIYQELFWLCCIVLLNIYVFNIGKDSIQFCFFLFAYIVCCSNLSNYIKSFLIFILFYIESIYFRSYFILVAVFFIAIYFTTFRMQHFSKKVNPLSYYMILLLIVYAFLILSSVLFPNQYNDVINARSGVNDDREGSADANTMITNIIPGDSLLSSLLNYPINAIRILIPLELLLKGLSYLPFILFQITATIYLIKYSRNVLNHTITDSRSILIYSVYLAFLLTSFFFEPDFGSCIRHEMAAFPVFQYLFFSSHCQFLTTGNKHKEIN